MLQEIVLQLVTDFGYMDLPTKLVFGFWLLCVIMFYSMLITIIGNLTLQLMSKIRNTIIKKFFKYV
jgi:hypothetical protein